MQKVPFATLHIIGCTPHHVEIGYGSCSSPEHRASLDRPKPQEVGKEEGKNSYSFVVIGASNRARDVARDDGDETGSKEASSSIPHLAGEKKGSYGCETTEGGRKKGRERVRESERERERERGKKRERERKRDQKRVQAGLL